MRTMVWKCVVVCGVLGGTMGAPAQTSMGMQQEMMGGMQSITAAIMQPTTGEPYKADKVTRSVQKLSDGTVISRATRGLIARDGMGRLREELYLVQSGQVNGTQSNQKLQSATVGDPVAHTMLIWTDEQAKVAMQMQLPSLSGALSKPNPAGTSVAVASAGTSLKPNVAAGGSSPGNAVRTEELGQQAIEGVLATGTRTTTTIPVGSIGNDRPITVMHEEWRSPELKILIKTVDTDPRTGEQTMELEGLVRMEPDAALFQAPKGYKVMDMAELMKGLGSLGKAKTP